MKSGINPVSYTKAKSLSSLGDEGDSTFVGRVCVGYATKGRAWVLATVLEELRKQAVAPEHIIISCTSVDDVGSLSEDPRVKILFGAPGLARQRNAILDNLPSGIDTVVFFDDDFVAHSNWLAASISALRSDSSVACVTGNVVVDGIKGPGLSFEEARYHLAKHAAPAIGAGYRILKYSPYGCNMAFKVSAIKGRRFDERLVLYGWLEDRDFGGSLLRDGWELVKIEEAYGVHLGVKVGRVAGRRLGYSQVINPIYLNRKGTMALPDVIDHLFRNIISNLVGSFRFNGFIDRRGRLVGNALAVFDLLRGRCCPERAGTL